MVDIPTTEDAVVRLAFELRDRIAKNEQTAKLEAEEVATALSGVVEDLSQPTEHDLEVLFENESELDLPNDAIDDDGLWFEIVEDASRAYVREVAESGRDDGCSNGLLAGKRLREISYQQYLDDKSAAVKNFRSKMTDAERKDPGDAINRLSKGKTDPHDMIYGRVGDAAYRLGLFQGILSSTTPELRMVMPDDRPYRNRATRFSQRAD